jgi:hypothetical protein
MNRLVFLYLLFGILSKIGYAQDSNDLKAFKLPEKTSMVAGKTRQLPLDKPLKMVAFIDPLASSLNKEAEVWKYFIGSMDTDSIGFVFVVRDNSDIVNFKHYWFVEMAMDYPFFHDKGNRVFEINEISDERSGQTMLLNRDNEIVLTGGSPINTDPYNRYRSELHKRTTAMGIEGAVRGVIVEQTESGGTKWFHVNEPVYVNENDEVVPTKQAKEGIYSKKWVPGISPLSDTVRLIKRNQ